MGSGIHAMSNRNRAANSNLFLGFFCGGTELALRILRLHEALSSGSSVRLPSMAPPIWGAIDYRGDALPVVDLAAKLQLSAPQTAEEYWVIVVDVSVEGERMVLGVLAEGISGAYELARNQIRAPNGDCAIPPPLLLGMGELGSRMLPLVDIGRVISTRDLEIASAIGDRELRASASLELKATD